MVVISHTEFCTATILAPFYCLIGFCHLFSRLLIFIVCPGFFWFFRHVCKITKSDCFLLQVCLLAGSASLYAIA